MTSSRRMALALVVGCLTLSGCGSDNEGPSAPTATPTMGPTPVRDACAGRCVVLEPGENDRENLQRALLEARPGETILLRAGTYRLSGQLSLDVDRVTIRGEGMDRTVLSFANQTSGSEGLFVTANDFTIEDVGLEDGPGDLLKILGGTDIVIRRVRAEWTRGPNTSNGAYGFYPIDSRNVLIEDSVVRGASDAGVYVGQCHNVIVRRNYVYENVAGIEIENSTDADVYGNQATRNTGGVLVFNLPGLPFIDGRRTRVFDNDIFENNVPNFAAPGTSVSAVPKGTGLMILANDEVEVFGNRFHRNDTTHVLVIAYSTAQIIGGLRGNDPRYDRNSETIFVYDNSYTEGGTNPDRGVRNLLEPVTGMPLPDIVIDGIVNRRKFVDGRLPEELRTCIQEPTARLFNIDIGGGGSSASGDPSQYDCRFPELPRVTLPGVEETAPPALAFPTPGVPTPTPSMETEETRCLVGPGTEVSFDVEDEPCEFLSSYRFFVDDASQTPNDGVVPYDLNTQLFSDYTNKHRFVFLPPGTAARYDANETFDFPVGTVIIKTFSSPADLRSPAGVGRLLETRLLVRREDGWIGLPYVWDEEQSDARLRVVGTELSVTAIQQDGVERTFPYNAPNANQCKECHREVIGVNRPIGPKARHLNKDYDYGSGSENQLVHWTRIGILSGAPEDPATAPRTAVFDDPASGTLEDRARGYLDVNCSSCHNPQGAARTTGLFLGPEEFEPLRIGICKSPVAAGRGTGGRRYDIVPGNPDASILPFRMQSTDPGIAMPELGRVRSHAEGVEVIREWIASLAGSCEVTP